MRRGTIKALLPVMTAFANGEEIQFLNAEGEWKNGRSDMGFNLSPEKYRIKPTPVVVKHWIIVSRQSAVPMPAPGGPVIFSAEADANYRLSHTLDPEKWVVVEMTGSYER